MKGSNLIPISHVPRTLKANRPPHPCTSSQSCVHLFHIVLHANTRSCVAQILGGNGYVSEYPTGRILRDAKLYEIGAGTSEVRSCVCVCGLAARLLGALPCPHCPVLLLPLPLQLLLLLPAAPTLGFTALLCKLHHTAALLSCVSVLHLCNKTHHRCAGT